MGGVSLPPSVCPAPRQSKAPGTRPGVAPLFRCGFLAPHIVDHAVEAGPLLRGKLLHDADDFGGRFSDGVPRHKLGLIVTIPVFGQSVVKSGAVFGFGGFEPEKRPQNGVDLLPGWPPERT